MAQRELTAPVALTTGDGLLDPEAIGWSRRPLHDARLTGARGRKKRWIYWGIASDEVVLALTIADVDYLSLVVVSLLDVASGTFTEQVSVRPMGVALHLPDSVRGDDLVIERRGLEVSIRERGESTLLSMRAPSKRLRAELTIDRGDESLSVVIPWSDERFQLTTKAIAMPVRGSVFHGAREHRLDSPRAFACLDYGRGVWPHRSRWQWAAAAGEVSGVRVGINLGGTWTDGTGQTENGIVFAGRLHKIHDDLTFAHDGSGIPRRISTREGSASHVDLSFEPVVRRRLTLEAVALASRLRWGFGHFRGVIRAEDGPALRIDGMRGWAEDHRARW